jgi:hypothetical protein
MTDKVWLFILLAFLVIELLWLLAWQFAREVLFWVRVRERATPFRPPTDRV